MKGLVRTLTTPALLAGLAAAAPAGAAEYWLCAGSTVKTLPDGGVVTMWGYAQDDNANLIDGCGSGVVQVPGPQLTVPPGDGALTVHLLNNLPGIGGAPVPTSLIIPGQQAPMTPVYGANGRVRSFTHETAAGAIGNYSWSGLRPGSYVYHSGTHPAVQVQMGLYGAMLHDEAVGQAYPGVAYDRELMLFYSEIDPSLHQAVADGSYGGPTYPSTIDYLPRYFLVNGEPWQPGSAPLAAGNVGERVLLRLFNMGLEPHVPMIQGQSVALVAEDGRPHPYPRRQYSVEMAAGKSRDAIMVAGAPGSYPVYDRTLDLSSGPGGTGGLMSVLAVNNTLQGALASAAVDSRWTSVALPAGLTDPVIIAGPPSYNGGQPGVVQLRNIDPTGFRMRFKEWSYLDGWHGSEQVSWLALPPGRYVLADGSIWEVGRYSLSGTGAWAAQGFAEGFPAAPQLFLTLQSSNGGQPVTVRARAVDANGFHSALFEEDALMDGHVAETVGYLAVYHPNGSGNTVLGGQPLAYSLGTASVTHSFAPVLSGSHQLKAEEEQSLDPEVWHLAEQVAVMELGGHLFAQDVSAVGKDTIALRRR